MNRKFIKENKQLVREFLGKILGSIMLGKLNKCKCASIRNRARGTGGASAGPYLEILIDRCKFDNLQENCMKNSE